MSLKVLVVDDEQMDRDMIRETLATHGVQVQIADGCWQAQTLVDQEKFDGIFVGLAGPEAPGLSLTRGIRRSSWNRHTPVVLLAGDGDTGTRVEAFEAGGTFFLEKPLDGLKLRRLLASTRGAMFEERRRATRVPLSAEVVCAIGLKKIRGTSLNLSRDGLLFQSDGSLRRGLHVQLSFRLDKSRPFIQTKGMVMRVDEAHRAGVRFIPLSEDDRLRVRDHIARIVDLL